MKKDIMVSTRRHQAPMHAILKRAKIGNEDKYGRGIWIGERDLPAIKEYFQKHGADMNGGDWWLNGTNQHNQVKWSEFANLFKSEEQKEQERATAAVNRIYKVTDTKSGKLLMFVEAGSMREAIDKALFKGAPVDCLVKESN